MLSVSVNSSNGNAAENVFRNGFGYTNKTLSDWILRGPTSDTTYFADYIAIGCQPQWGYSTGQADLTTILPFPMTESFISLCCANSYWTNAGCNVSNTAITLSQAQTDKSSTRHNGPLCWLVLGKQPQWGNLWAGYTEVLNWYFPLTTSQVYAVCLTKHTKNISSGHNWEPARIEEWNNSYARIHPDGDLGYSVIAICKAQQQWGTNTIGSRTTRTEAYPLPYSEFCLPIVSGKGYVGELNYGFGVGVTNFGLTSVTIANNSEDSGYRWTGYTYIVVGAQQQWGTTDMGDTRKYIDVPYPIAFSNATYLATVIDSIGGTSDSYWTGVSLAWSIGDTTKSTCRFVSTSGAGVISWIAIGS